MNEAFLTQQENMLLCPLCADTYVHIEDAYMAGRAREDGPVKHVRVHSDGQVDQGADLHTPIQEGGRRHSIALGGYCETCGGRFAIEFRQHKGQTITKLLRSEWTPVT